MINLSSETAQTTVQNTKETLNKITNTFEFLKIFGFRTFPTSKTYLNPDERELEQWRLSLPTLRKIPINLPNVNHFRRIWVRRIPKKIGEPSALIRRDCGVAEVVNVRDFQREFAEP